MFLKLKVQLSARAGSFLGSLWHLQQSLCVACVQLELRALYSTRSRKQWGLDVTVCEALPDDRGCSALFSAFSFAASSSRSLQTSSASAGAFGAAELWIL